MATMMEPNPGLEDGMVDTSMGKLHYVRAGHGTPLLLIHGGFGSWLHWRANIEALAQHHTVFAIDLPGFGLSCDAPADSDIDALARPIGEAIAGLRASLPLALRDTPFGIAAFSFGTTVAVRVGLLFPEAVRALLLVNPPGLGQVSEEVKAMQARAAEAARNQGLRAGLAITLHELMVKDQALATPEALDLLEQCVRQNRFVSRQLSRSVQLRPMLAALGMPVHVMLGQDDPHQRHELAARRDWLMQNLGPEAVSVIPDSGHWLQYEQAARFNAYALRFFSEGQS